MFEQKANLAPKQVAISYGVNDPKYKEPIWAKLIYAGVAYREDEWQMYLKAWLESINPNLTISLHSCAMRYDPHTPRYRFKAGMPDMHILNKDTGKTLWLELKREGGEGGNLENRRGKLRDSQIEAHKFLLREGQNVCVSYGMVDSLNIISDYFNLPPSCKDWDYSYQNQ